MKPTFNFRITIFILALILSNLACGLSQPMATATRTPTAKVFPNKTPTRTQKPTLTNPPGNSGELIHVWASAGEATSKYGSSDDAWSAQQAASAPDSPTCGDSTTAWASAESDGVDSITMYYYDPPLIPNEINIVQNYNPSQVVKVELLDAYGEHGDAVIYESEPKATGECPYTLSIPVTGIDYLVMGVRITIDQSVLGLGWNEIDAVELVGYPETGYEAQPTTYSLPEGVWEDVYALPIFPSAEGVSYTFDSILIYSVSDSNRQEVIDFIIENLEGIGWLLDVDEAGNCRDVNRCQSKLDGLDYGSADNGLWYFIHTDSSDVFLTLTVDEDSYGIIISMSLVR